MVRVLDADKHNFVSIILTILRMSALKTLTLVTENKLVFSHLSSLFTVIRIRE